MKRRELVIIWDHIAGATPSRAGIQELLAKEFKVEAEKVDIKGIFSLKGRPQSRIKVHVLEEAKASVAKSAAGQAESGTPQNKGSTKPEEKQVQ